MGKAEVMAILSALDVPRIPSNEIAEQTGWTAVAVRKLAYLMRRAGLMKPVGSQRNVIVGRRKLDGGVTQEVRFVGFADAEAAGFQPSGIRRAVSGVQSKHAGYKWHYEVVRGVRVETGQ